MTKKLFFQAILKFLLGVILVGLLIFIPAGTINFFNGWLLMAVLFIPMLIVGIIMMIKNPKLLQSRLDAKERLKKQGVIIILCGIMFVTGFVLAGLDFRFGWVVLPSWVSFLAVVLFLLSYIMFGEVLRENTFLSRTIKVEDKQKLVDTDLYGVVRHPMYSATIVLFLCMPLILGSIISFFVFLIYPILIVCRINGEEKFLEKELAGYKEYQKKVKYRLIPFIW